MTQKSVDETVATRSRAQRVSKSLEDLLHFNADNKKNFDEIDFTSQEG